MLAVDRGGGLVLGRYALTRCYRATLSPKGARDVRGGEFRQAKIQNLRLPAIRDENVRGLDVAMDDAFLVRSVQGVSGLNRQLQHLFDFQRLALDAMLKGLALQVLH